MNAPLTVPEAAPMLSDQVFSRTAGAQLVRGNSVRILQDAVDAEHHEQHHRVFEQIVVERAKELGREKGRETSLRQQAQRCFHSGAAGPDD